MKEATGEVSMTVVTLVAIAVIGAILALFWQPITNKISSLWGEGENNTKGNEKNEHSRRSCSKVN